MVHLHHWLFLRNETAILDYGIATTIMMVNCDCFLFLPLHFQLLLVYTEVQQQAFITRRYLLRTNNQPNCKLDAVLL